VLEDGLRLDVRTFRRRGWLDAGGMDGVLRWWRDGKETAALRCRIDAAAMMLSYTTGNENGQPVPVEVTVAMVRSACRFGVHRHYWLCPRCWRRCEVLASGGRGFARRRCLRLRYACQRLAPLDRLQARADKIAARLGGDGEFLLKPKWMRWRTFHRLAEQSQAFDVEAHALFEQRCVRLVAGIRRLAARA
jgi:hypothetical protein